MLSSRRRDNRVQFLRIYDYRRTRTVALDDGLALMTISGRLFGSFNVALGLVVGTTGTAVDLGYRSRLWTRTCQSVGWQGRRRRRDQTRELAHRYGRDRCHEIGRLESLRKNRMGQMMRCRLTSANRCALRFF